MEEQTTYQEPFKEEYWVAALDTLKKEERKALFKKWTPAALALVILAAIVFGFQLNKEASGLPLKTISKDPTVDTRFSSITVHNNKLQVAELTAESIQEEGIQIIAKVEPLESKANSKTAPRANNSKGGEVVFKSSETVDVLKRSSNEPKAAQTENHEGDYSGETEVQSFREINAGKGTTEENVNQENSGNENIGKTVDDQKEPTQTFDAGAPILTQETSDAEEGAATYENYKMNLLSAAINYNVPALLSTKHYSKKQMRVSDQRAKFHKTAYRGSALRGHVGSALLTGYGSEKGLIDWNPSFGLNYETKVRGPWWASIGVGFQQINGVRYQADFFADELSFGYSTVRTRVATNTLYILEVPVQVWRDFSMRSSLMIGANAEVIVNSKSGLSETKLGGNESQELSKSDSFGYVQGLNQALFGARLGYRYRFSKTTDISLIKQFGLSEVNNGEFYLNNGNDLNGRWILQLNFTLK